MSQIPRNRLNKLYCGDGVYIAYDGFNFILTTEETKPGRAAASVTNTIVLEPDAAAAIRSFINRISAAGRR